MLKFLTKVPIKVEMVHCMLQESKWITIGSRTSLASCGGTSNETVLKSTFVYESVHGKMKKSPGTQNKTMCN